MEIAVCTLATSETDSYSQYTNENKKGYCERNGYDLIIETESLDTDLPVPWTKIKVLQKAIQIDKYDFVVWMDADLWIFNMDLKLENLFDNEHLLFISKDKAGPNSGVFAMKVCKESVDILNDWYDRTEFIEHQWWENAAVHQWYNEGVNRLVVKLIDKTIWNSYLNEKTSETNICHLAGATLKERENFFAGCASGDII